MRGSDVAPQKRRKRRTRTKLVDVEQFQSFSTLTIGTTPLAPLDSKHAAFDNRAHTRKGRVVAQIEANAAEAQAEANVARKEHARAAAVRSPAIDPPRSIPIMTALFGFRHGR